MTIDKETVEKFDESTNKLCDEIKNVINDSGTTFGAKMCALENVLLDLAITNPKCENTFIASLEFMKNEIKKEFELIKQIRPSTT